MTMGNIYSYSYSTYIKLRCLVEYYYPLANDTDLHEVFPNIFVGNISTCFNKPILQESGITHIISVLPSFTAPYPDDFQYLILDAIDNQDFDLSQHFEQANQFIKSALENNGKIYVHCICGVSRSVSIVCAYLIKEHQMTLEEVIEKIKFKRPVANPNDGFRQQLDNINQECNFEPSDH